MKPIRLVANRPRRFYCAAGAADLHGPVGVVRCLPPRADEARS
jgi:hypothetical protein